ncbi:MAG: HEAT repeat domain-containing protein [Verrucomicrobia bacterium]|nr:HEAT repeat domain-containing protein [Verrucomicrobiota bacterium]
MLTNSSQNFAAGQISRTGQTGQTRQTKDLFSRLLSLTALLACLAAPSPLRAVDPAGTAELRLKLIAVLQSDAPPAEKAITCKRLAVYGNRDAVPALAPLLLSKELNSWARIALEAIPDPACDDALRDALGKVQGRLLVGVMNSIGVRRDAKAVEPLIARLNDADGEVASAAASALGRIGGEQAAAVLVKALLSARKDVVSEVAEGCVRCAEKFLADGKAAEAVTLYDTVRKASVPKQRILEATRGAILARGAAGLPLLVEHLRSTDKGMFSIALSTARELPGQEVTQAVAAEMERSAVDRQTMLVMVLADRADASVLPTIRKAAQSGPKPMRLAAITALERMGTVEVVPVLLDGATDEDRELAQAAKAALVRLPGKQVNGELVARLSQAAGKQSRVLLELAGLRRIGEALPAAVKCAEDSDATIRAAAVGAIGLLGEEKQAADLVRLLEKSQTPRDREEIEKALVGICGRRGANCLPAVLPLAQSANSEFRLIALHTLSGVGGAAALNAVKSASNDQDEAVQDEAVRTLASWPGNWPDDSGVAEPLLALAKSGKKQSHQVLGLRGYLEYVQAAKKLQSDEKVAKVKELLPLITRSEEKRLAISALSAAPTAAGLEMLVAFAADSSVAEEASLAIVTTAGKDDLKGATKELRRGALQTVVEKSKTDRTRRKAEEALKRIR